jgi:hypothetical protein
MTIEVSKAQQDWILAYAKQEAISPGKAAELLLGQKIVEDAAKAMGLQIEKAA